MDGGGMALEDGVVNYAQTYEWRDFDGSLHSVTAGWFPSMEEARNSARSLAIASGWTPPKWWQFWRWADQPRK